MDEITKEDAEFVQRNDMGLYDKYTVMRNDMGDMKGGKHYGCMHFVIDMRHDPHAKQTLLVYAQLVESTKPNLASDIRKWFEENE